jgi:thiamine-monophosphate kinase
MKENKGLPGLKELGEFGLIDHLTKQFEIHHKSTLKAAGDDAAVLNHEGSDIVVTTDLLTEGIHFNLIYTPLKHLGYKAVVSNLSDVYAMNCEPLQIVVSIAFSSRFTLENMDSIYEGIRLACQNYGIDMVGGDTSSSLTGLTISITAIGRGEKGKITYRGGAKENNLICVSGDLGGSYIGLQLLEREKSIYLSNVQNQPKLEGYDYVLERQLKPEPRRDIIKLLKEMGIVPTSMIDISDGLSSETIHITKQSNKGCRIYADKIPIHPETKRVAEELNIEPMVAALNGGEDYELLFTIDQKDFEKLKNTQGITVIGHIIPPEKGRHLVLSDGSTTEIIAMGWNTLRGEQEEEGRKI